MTQAKVPLVVLGASLGGVLAAWRAAQALPRAEGAVSAPVWLVAEQAWIGGQMTAQGVPPDEHPLIEHAGSASASYRQFRADIRTAYRTMPGFVDISTMTPGLSNPGDGWVSRLCFEPSLAARWFERLLAPLVAQGRLRILRFARAVAVRREGRRIAALMLREADGRVSWLDVQSVIDATDTGDLLRLAHLPCRIGKESRAQFGEPDAPDEADALDQQPVTHVLALRQGIGGTATFDEPPPGYTRWRAHRLPHHGHAQFSAFMPGRGRGVSAHLPLVAAGTTLDWWRYRRIVSAAQWPAGGPHARADATLVNWAQNDFALHPLLDGPRPQAEVERAAAELSMCLLHWLQTEAPRPDGGAGFPNWQPAGDLLGTRDGLAQQVYVRESRRIVAMTTLTQNDLQRPAEPGRARADAAATGWYNLDIHPTCISGHGLNAPVEPFVLPLGCWVPRDVDNLLPGCKNIGVSHLANACTRVHPVEWAVGEVAGLLAAESLASGHAPAAIVQDRDHLRAVQTRIDAAGIPRAWPAALLARRPAAH